MIFDDDEEFFNPNGRQAPQTLLGQIRERGNMSSSLAQQRADYDEGNSQMLDNATYGRQSEGPYNMENFIIEVLQLDTSDEHVRSMINWGEAGQYIIDKAVETINSGDKDEIHFTPQEDTEYKKIKFIYDKLANDLKQMICKHLKLSPCPLSNDDVIAAALTKYPDISFANGMTVGYKLKTIQDYIENKIKSETKGGRRRRGISRKRTGGKRSSGGKRSKKRRYSKKRKY
jgi:hypothetical protein